MDNTCPICLDEMKDPKILSCNHKIHEKCYLDLIKRGNIFIKCPMCRETNTSIERNRNDYKDNILKILSNVNDDGTIWNCICKTRASRGREGYSCKNKASILNYGMCKFHNKETLLEKDLKLMERYIYLIFSQRNGWLSKIFLFDTGKKLILKYGIEELDELMIKYYQFFSVVLKDGDIFIKNYDKFYEYYNLETPDREWIKKCKREYILF